LRDKAVGFPVSYGIFSDADYPGHVGLQLQ